MEASPSDRRSPAALHLAGSHGVGGAWAHLPRSSQQRLDLTKTGSRLRVLYNLQWFCLNCLKGEEIDGYMDFYVHVHGHGLHNVQYLCKCVQCICIIVYCFKMIAQSARYHTEVPRPSGVGVQVLVIVFGSNDVAFGCCNLRVDMWPSGINVDFGKHD